MRFRQLIKRIVCKSKLLRWQVRPTRSLSIIPGAHRLKLNFPLLHLCWDQKSFFYIAPANNSLRQLRGELPYCTVWYHIVSYCILCKIPVGNIRYGGNDLLIVSSSRKEKKTRERRSGKENKRKQGCDSVSLACASLHYCVCTPVRPLVWAHPALTHSASSAAIDMHFPTIPIPTLRRVTTCDGIIKQEEEGIVVVIKSRAWT